MKDKASAVAAPAPSNTTVKIAPPPSSLKKLTPRQEEKRLAKIARRAKRRDDGETN